MEKYIFIHHNCLFFLTGAPKSALNLSIRFVKNFAWASRVASAEAEALFGI